MKVERPAVAGIPGEGAEDLVIFVLREPPSALEGERLSHGVPLNAAVPVPSSAAAPTGARERHRAPGACTETRPLWPMAAIVTPTYQVAAGGHRWQIARGSRCDLRSGRDSPPERRSIVAATSTGCKTLHAADRCRTARRGSRPRGSLQRPLDQRLTIRAD